MELALRISRRTLDDKHSYYLLLYLGLSMFCLNNQGNQKTDGTIQRQIIEEEAANNEQSATLSVWTCQWSPSELIMVIYTSALYRPDKEWQQMISSLPSGWAVIVWGAPTPKAVADIEVTSYSETLKTVLNQSSIAIAMPKSLLWFQECKNW